MSNRSGRVIGWGLVALVLVYDGLTHAATGKVWPRLKGEEILPVMEGWPVIVLGLVEAAFGIYLGSRLLVKMD